MASAPATHTATAPRVTGKIIEVDGGLQSPNLEFPLPDL